MDERAGLTAAKSITYVNAMETTGERIAAVRAGSGLSLAAFGKRLKISPAAVWYYENGRDVPVSVIRRMWMEFGVDLEWLVGRD